MSAEVTRVGRVVPGRVMLAVFISLAAGLALLVPPPPVALAASQGASSVSAAESGSCAIESGKAYCWGYDGNGELGDGRFGGPPSSIPVAVDTSGVLLGKTLVQIAAGQNLRCALDSAGKAYCWGANGSGELGDGSTVSSAVPVSVDTTGVLAGKTLTQIAVGLTYACALDSSGRAYCWGTNDHGQLGNGSTTGSAVPVAVDATGVIVNTCGSRSFRRLPAGPPRRPRRRVVRRACR